MRICYLCGLIAVLTGGFGFRLTAVVLDPSFRETVFVTVNPEITGVAWAPDGSNRLFVSHKDGTVEIVKNGAVLPTPFVTVSPVQTSSECGLIGICFDPNFVNNGHVYLFVTVSSSEQQIIRYQAVGDIGTNKTVIVPGLPTIGANHDGGAIGIGADGKLYWAIGDLGTLTGVDADLASLAAKVGRANRDGSVPFDNPFVDGPGGANDYIWARGFRNPFTLTFQPSTGALWVNCVGTSYEQIFLVNAGDHAGWNDYENNQPDGFIKPKIKYRTNGWDTRTLQPGTGASRDGSGTVTFTTTAAHGFRVGEKITISGVSNASFNGQVFVATIPSPTTFTAVQPGLPAISGSGSAVTLFQGGCVTGGTFYESTAVPAIYRGNFFYGDLNNIGRVMRASLNASDEVAFVDYFAQSVALALDTAVGPDGALYCATYDGIIYRMAYTNFTSQQLHVTPTVVRTFENESSVITVCLGKAPAGTVQVNVSRTAGDPSIEVASGATLSFNPANWSVPQAVRLDVLTDGDVTNGTATITVSAAGISPETVTVHAADVVAPILSLSLLDTDPVQLRLSGIQGQTYVLEAASNLLAPWAPFATSTLVGSFTNIIDPGSVTAPSRFYRARQP